MPDIGEDLELGTVARLLDAGLAAGTVQWVAQAQMWLIKSYEASRAILVDRGFVSLAPSRELPPGLPPAIETAARRGIEVQARWMGTRDDGHLRIRAIGAAPLGPRPLSRVEPGFRARAKALLDAIVARGQGDLVADFTDIFVRDGFLDLMGVPARHRTTADRCRLDVDSYAQHTPGSLVRTGLVQAAMIPIFEEMLDAPVPEGAVILAAVQAALAGGRIDRDEALALLSVQVVAGISSSQTAVGDLVLRLAADAELRAFAAADLGRLDRLVEESVRLGEHHFARPYVALDEVVLSDRTLPAGTLFLLNSYDPNRDPAQFPDPERFDPERQPQHLAFGAGVRRCIGRHLVHLELVIAAEALIGAFPHLPAACLGPDSAVGVYARSNGLSPVS
ncbi:MAG: cytochrome P450 [Novosphingobium sp.]|nr:cytochrome P450 [Novosphingobium sp.]